MRGVWCEGRVVCMWCERYEVVVQYRGATYSLFSIKMLLTCCSV